MPSFRRAVLLALAVLSIAVACGGGGGDSNAPPGTGPDGKPLPAVCTNAVRDGIESDVDCGPGYAPRAIGKKCGMAGDCASHVCAGGICQAAPSCTDGTLSLGETDVDCGGAACAACANGKKCDVARDCQINVCTSNVCQDRSCTDNTKNGTETDTDCGGSGCGGCDDGKTCTADTDCKSARCQAGHCAAPACTDGVKNGAETGVDCGGPSCKNCPTPIKGGGRRPIWPRRPRFSTPDPTPCRPA